MGDIVGRYIVPASLMLIPEFRIEATQRAEKSARHATAAAADKALSRQRDRALSSPDAPAAQLDWRAGGEAATRSILGMVQDIANRKPDVIVVLDPLRKRYERSFSIPPKNNFTGNFSRYTAKKISFRKQNCVPFARHLATVATEMGLLVAVESKSINLGPLSRIKTARKIKSETETLTTSCMMPLYFIDYAYSGYKLLPLSLSAASPQKHYRYGMALARAAATSEYDIAVISVLELSSKLVEGGAKGFYSQAGACNESIAQFITNGDAAGLMTLDRRKLNAAAIQGVDGAIALMGTCDKRTMVAKGFCYEEYNGTGLIAGEIQLGEKTPSAYSEFAALQTEARKAKRESEAPLVALARNAMHHYLTSKGGTLKVPKTLPREFQDAAGGAVVSVYQDGRLISRSGSVYPGKANIALEVIYNAIDALRYDPITNPVFKGISLKNLDQHDIVVDVAAQPEEIEDVTQLDPKRYGVYVAGNRKTDKGKTGMVLPNTEGVEGSEEQLTLALTRAGLYGKKAFSCYRFEVRHYE